MRTFFLAVRGAILGAIAGVAVCALIGAVGFEIGALHRPNADLRPADAWLLGALWIGLGGGRFAAPAGAVVGLLVGWGRGARRGPGRGA